RQYGIRYRASLQEPGTLNNKTITLKRMTKQTIIMLFMLVFITNVFSQTEPTKIVINNVNIFDGKEDRLVKGNILIEGNLIKTISTNTIIPSPEDEIIIIDGKGKYVIPGL